MRQALASVSAILAVMTGACATPMDDGAAEGGNGEMAQCDATSAQALVGQVATESLGARILSLTGARNLRWVPPRTAVTMDFRPDRVTVSYDDDRVIERITCG